MKKQNHIFNTKNIIGAFIAIVMVSSILGMWNSGGTNAAPVYKGYKFSIFGNRLQTVAGGQSVLFSYHPTSVENISLDNNAMAAIKATKMLYLSFDPDDKNIAEIELLRKEMIEKDLPNLGIYAASGVSNESAVYSLPVITCQNSTAYIPVIYMHTSNKTGIAYNFNCIEIEGREIYDLVALKDRLFYGLYGIIQ